MDRDSNGVVVWFCIQLQADPADHDAFPFVVLGNKVDVDDGNSRVVSLFLPQFLRFLRLYVVFE